jgi:hypothetical protein
MVIILGDLKNRNDKAFTGVLECPRCQNLKGYDRTKQVWKEIGRQTPTRIQYRCGHCKQSLIYDVSK